MSRLDRVIAELAAETDDVVTRAQIAACGGTDEMISGRLVDRIWQSPHPGVYSLGAAPLSWTQQARAALLACDSEAALTGAAGVRNYGLDGTEQRTDIQVVIGHSKQSMPKGVKVLRSRRRCAAPGSITAFEPHRSSAASLTTPPSPMNFRLSERWSQLWTGS